MFKIKKEELSKLRGAAVAGKVCKIYIFRHAQTYYNRNKIFTGWKDSRLTPLGMGQAKLIAEKLNRKQIDVAFHTRLSRSKQTLNEVLKYHPECRLKIADDRMIERNYGALSGQTHAVFIRKHGKKLFDVYRRSYDVLPPRGESIKMVEKRALSFVRDLITFIKKYKVNVAISAHGNSMRPFRRYFEKLSVNEMMKLENPWDDYFEYDVKV